MKELKSKKGNSWVTPSGAEAYLHNGTVTDMKFKNNSMSGTKLGRKPSVSPLLVSYRVVEHEQCGEQLELESVAAPVVAG